MISFHNLADIPGFTPIITILLLIVFAWGISKLVKAVQIAENPPEGISEYEHKHMWKRQLIKGGSIIVFVGFAFFFYFHVFVLTGPDTPPTVDSGYNKVLDQVEPENRTPEELQKDADEKRDKTGYLDQVGKQETLEQSQQEADDYIQKALERAKQREEKSE